MCVCVCVCVCVCSGGVGSLAGPALAGALLKEVMNINIELLIGAIGQPHFTCHYYLRMRSVGLAQADCNDSS